jgi:hypothetical protein
MIGFLIVSSKAWTMGAIFVKGSHDEKPSTHLRGGCKDAGLMVHRVLLQKELKGGSNGL